MAQLEKIKEIISPIKNDLDIFEKNLEQIINSQDNFLKDDLRDFIFTNPKRLRPILIFLFSKILKIKNNENILKIALITELFHSASLIHDDILDEEILRRGKSTFFKKYGSKLAVLEGDLLLTLALEILSETNPDILKIFSQKIKKTLNGELTQNSILNTIPDEKTYLDKTFNKTGNLFLAGLEALFCLKNIEKEKKEALLDFMKNFSIAFQIKNDTNDINSDIKNGNYTLIVLYFLKENSIEDLNKNSNFEKYKNQTYEKIEHFKNLALENLASIENSEYKQSLIKLTAEVLRNL